MLIEHFHMAPVAAARSCLLSALASSETSGFRPSWLRTSAEERKPSTLKIALAQSIWSSSLSLFRIFTKSSIIPSV
ncbi:hypothetical protein GOODEAATRI_032019 [Goodea atripinnis]|uniref:Secreted protein n=1 Tax=Goodea atripinnis TaxID=208336 RepID=A0ABV0NPW3_9TELE